MFAISGLALIVTAITAPEGITGLVRKAAARLAPPGATEPDAGPWRRRHDARLLEVDDLTVRYGGVVALDDVSPRRSTPGEVVGLIGPNGAGKTTFIDALTGFTPPTGGRVALRRRRLTDGRARTSGPGAGWSAPSSRSSCSTT